MSGRLLLVAVGLLTVIAALIWVAVRTGALRRPGPLLAALALVVGVAIVLAGVWSPASAAFRASSTSSRADWSKAIVRCPSVSSPGRSH